ncbi:MAG: phosphatidate cytidylyltransferase [Candidatus Omnitrophica bacterium]|nr:phosphatidate cytidylyltransferase [Candidatus Omnitrophota bacterium]MDD5236720.1 phosphatidate cytidylyltransferase [Candidatus Omnitrophota bacterium]MDD5610604.1 phosphatidate cytidylyltransferase [Candidatus Omnitrophota bacterium]
MNKIAKRVVSATLVSLGVAAALMNYWASGIVVIVLSVLGLQEYFKMVEKKGVQIYKWFGTVIGIAIPVSTLFKFELTKNWELLFIVIALVALIVLQFARRQNHGSVIDIAVTMFGILYITWFFSFIIKIMILPQGMGLLAALLLMTKMGDIGAYVVGSKFGKTPLIPRISPNKTVEGAFGGLFFSVCGALLSWKFLNFSLLHLVLLGAFIGLIGQLGDLSESLFKRDCEVKDSSGLFPGMGGVLDIIDSLLFTAPVFYIYMVVKIL